MTWILPAILMYLSSVILYLFVRAAQKQQIPTEIYSLWMFGLPGIIFSILIPLKNVPVTNDVSNWLLLIFSAIFFSWLGNVFSLLSLLKSSNPGYPLIISKSYVIFTAIASIWLFRAPLGFKSIIGIGLIVLFSAIITLSDRKKGNAETTSLLWFWYAMGAFLCWGCLALASKYMLNHGVEVLLRLMVVHVLVSLILLTELIIKKKPLIQLFQNLPIQVGVGVSAGLFNYFMQVGINLSPNPGYINATNAASISAVTIASAVIFKDQLSWKKMVGIVGATIGLVFLFV